MDIVIDFDGTVVTHNYPQVGKDIGAKDVLHKLLKKRHNLILFTMRSGRELHEALEWFKLNEIDLYGVQYNPTQAQWTCSNKCHGQLYIDDAALGCPLTYPKDGSRPYANWKEIEKLLKKHNIL